MGALRELIAVAGIITYREGLVNMTVNEGVVGWPMRVVQERPATTTTCHNK
jgi:hypothetical protein